jgi:hypothetical protein
LVVFPRALFALSFRLFHSFSVFHHASVLKPNALVVHSHKSIPLVGRCE